MWTLTFDTHRVVYKDERIWTDSQVLDTMIESLLPAALTVQATAVGPYAQILDTPVFQDGHIAYAFITTLLREWMQVSNWTTEGDDYDWPYEASEETAVFGNDCHAPDSGRFCETPGKRPLVPEEPLTAGEKQAIKRYTNLSYDVINTHLQDKAENDLYPEHKVMIRQLDSVIEKAGTLKEPIIVYRGMGFRGKNPPSDEKVEAYIDKTFIPGKTVSLGRGFKSASPTPETPLAHAQTSKSMGFFFKIKATKGADITEWSHLPEEKEILLPRGGRYKVTAVKRNQEFKLKDGTTTTRTVIEVEQL